MSENKNWILGRPLVFGDKEQIAEIQRIEAIKKQKAERSQKGLDLDDLNIDVEEVITSSFSFDCFECDKKIYTEIEGVNLEEDDADDQYLTQCRNCKCKYEIKDNFIHIKK